MEIVSVQILNDVDNHSAILTFSAWKESHHFGVILKNTLSKILV